MTVLVVFGGLMVLWLASILVLVRVRPDWVLERKRRGYGYPEEEEGPYVGLRQGSPYDMLSPGSACLALAPLVAAVCLPVSVVVTATMRSVNNKTAARAELEKELRAARKEIDDLLGRTPTTQGGK